MICIVIVTAVNIWILFEPGEVVIGYLSLVNMPTYWEGALLWVAVLHFILAWLLEKTNPFLSIFVDWANLKAYNWYHK